MSYAVRIIYPARRGKKGKTDLVVVKKTAASATAYAKKAAKRGLYKRSGWKTGARWNAPLVCVYNLAKWGKPVCYRAGYAANDPAAHQPAAVHKAAFHGSR